MMKRIGMILPVIVLAAMMLTVGCDTNSSNTPSIEKIDVAPTPEPPETKPVVIKTTKISRPVVVIETSMGTITAELWADSAPVTVKNFLDYAKAKHFDGLVFHRVIQGFMIQGGGFDAKMRQKETRDQIPNEATIDKKNDRGTLAMARTSIVDSASSQFFINLKDNDALNHRARTTRDFGYCAFGKVIDGMDVVDKIATVPVADRGGHQSVPITPVIIKSVRLAK